MKTYKIIVASLLVFAIGACKNRPEAAQEHVHDATLQLAAYNENFEVFAEATPFVVGQQSTVLAHFSWLKDFKPLESGSITASLIVGSDGIRQTLENPTKAGIYNFSLQPVVAGAGKIVFDITTPEGASQLVIRNVVVYTDEHEAFHTAEDAMISNSNAVTFTKEQSWKVDFATEEARKEPFGQIIRTTAQILPSQSDERIVTAKTNGIVAFHGDNVTSGKAVNAGQTLFAIEGGGMADNNMAVRYNEAESEYKRAKAEYERKKELAKEKIVSDSELLAAQTAFTNAEIVYNNLQKNFSAGKQLVSAPINGFITQVSVQNGEYIEAGQPVLTVSQNRHLLIKANLQPKYFPVLGGITSANIRVMDENKTYSLQELDGKVLSFGKSTGVENPLIPVLFEVKNNVGLLSGSFVEMFIKTRTNSQAVTVPSAAIVEEMGNYFVFVQLTPELFEKRSIRKGVTDGMRTEISEGLAEHERVVSKGAILVKLAQSAGALDAHSGHVH